MVVGFVSGDTACNSEEDRVRFEVSHDGLAHTVHVFFYSESA